MASTDISAPVVPRELAPRADIPDDPVAVWPHLTEIGQKVPLRRYLADIWHRREFAIEVPLGQLRAQNQNTVLGQVWHLANPLFLTLVYFVIFVQIIGGRAGMSGSEYLAFLLVGMLTFESTRTAMSAGARMIVKSRRLVQSINFPRAILPIAGLLQETISYLYALPVMWGILMLTGVRPGVTWLMVVPILIVMAMFNLGLTMFTARLSFHFRDVQQVLPYILRVWFYTSGALIPLDDRLSDFETLASILRHNPAYLFITISRDAFIGHQIDGMVWAEAGVWSIVSLVLGFWYFRRAESEYGRV